MERGTDQHPIWEDEKAANMVRILEDANKLYIAGVTMN